MQPQHSDHASNEKELYLSRYSANRIFVFDQFPNLIEFPVIRRKLFGVFSVKTGRRNFRRLQLVLVDEGAREHLGLFQLARVDAARHRLARTTSDVRRRRRVGLVQPVVAVVVDRQVRRQGPARAAAVGHRPGRGSTPGPAPVSPEVEGGRFRRLLTQPAAFRGPLARPDTVTERPVLFPGLGRVQGEEPLVVILDDDDVTDVLLVENALGLLLDDGGLKRRTR